MNYEYNFNSLFSGENEYLDHRIVIYTLRLIKSFCKLNTTYNATGIITIRLHANYNADIFEINSIAITNMEDNIEILCIYLTSSSILLFFSQK